MACSWASVMDTCMLFTSWEVRIRKKKTLPVVLDTANQIARFVKYRQLASECPNETHSCFIYLNMDIPLHDL